jgi:uncharacterized repeat protein (TIGR03806 family)
MALPFPSTAARPGLFPRRGTLLLGLLLVSAVIGCGDGVSPGGGGGDDDDDDDDDVAFPDSGPGFGDDDDGDPGPSGLDERPANPSCLAPARPRIAPVDIRLEPAFTELPSLTRPLFLTHPPSEPGRTYLIEQPGRVRTFTGSGGDAEVALDIRERVDSRPNEGGLLGIAFHPDYEANGEVFLSYTGQRDGGLHSVVSRFRRLDDGPRIDPDSEEIVFQTRQPAGNHNGGTILFGPDGLLYVSMGDGGGANDRFGHGQNRDSVLGAILRIDVDVPAADAYGIPPTNPFADGGGAPEIFAWGFRNPWRMSFDRGTGTLWAGDVGQGRLEEIDVVELGGNYGWPIREGDECFQAATCDREGLVDPVAVYGRGEGVSVTGGYVYRGQALPELVGVYLYGDFGSGRLWGLFEDPVDGGFDPTVLLDTGVDVASFAEDAEGELYLIGLSGTLRKIVPEDPSGGDDESFPRRLSETGCMDPSDPRQPGPGLVPYRPIAELWSDGAEKERWLAIPDGTQLALDPDGDFRFPEGTVLVKSFRQGGRLVETRLFVRHDDGSWGGYSYAWNEAETDAELLPSAARRTFSDGVSWAYPSRGQCLACHTEAAGRSLGLELAQLDHEIAYPSTGRTANQLDTLRGIGLLPASIAVARRRPNLTPYQGGDAAVGPRARSYLHVNCASCHRPEGPGRGEQDLRAEASLSAVGCGDRPIHGDLGLGDRARLLRPGDPARSLHVERMSRRDVYRMPPLASERVDALGVGLVADWIAGLGACD